MSKKASEFDYGTLPAPAPLAHEELIRLDTDRVRARREKRAWVFNYSIVTLEAPDLAARLEPWAKAIERAISPLRLGTCEITFNRPGPDPAVLPDGAELIGSYARFCADRISAIAPKRPVSVSLYWTPSVFMGEDPLNDWDLDLDPIRSEIRDATKTLYEALRPWGAGLDRLIFSFEYQPGEGAS